MPESTGLRCVGRWSYGPSYDVDGRTTPSETLVALARGSGVSLLRFSRQDSLSIELLSDINAEGLMCRVKVVDTLLYVGSRGGLEVYSIADEQNPVRLSWTPIPLNDFALQDSLVYTISGDDSFRIYNVSNPTSPVFRGACRDSGNLVSVAGNAAFLGDRWGLYVIDVTNPTSPHRIGSWGSAVEQVLARGHLCYVTTFNPNEPGDVVFHILDVTTPASPHQLGSLDSVGGYDVHLVDTLAFCSGDGDLTRFSIVSVADSTRPYAVSSVAEAGWGWGIWASGLAQSAFVGCHWEGLQVYDTRNTAQPERDTYLLGADRAVDIWLDNGRAYVANEMAGLKILNVTNPAVPRLLGSYDSAGQMPFMHSVVARDSFAYVRWGIPPFRTVDVSDPALPRYAAGLDIFNPPEDMVIRDSLVYVAEMNRFQVVNIARPREPVLVGSCTTQDGVYFGLAVQDSLAYTVGDGFQIVNIARPDSPFLVSTTAGGASGLAVRDTFAYIPDGWDTMHVYSVAIPAAPRLLSAVPCGVWPWDAALGESKLYVAASDGWGVDVYDITTPGQPVRRGRASAPYDIRRLSYDNGLLYAAMWEAGVAVYETTATGIHEQTATTEKPSALRVWPNVTGDNVRFTVGAGARGLDVAVYDVSGKRLRDVSLQVSTKGGATEGELGLSALPSGLYIVRVNYEGASITAKVVKAKGR